MIALVTGTIGVSIRWTWKQVGLTHHHPQTAKPYRIPRLARNLGRRSSSCVGSHCQWYLDRSLHEVRSSTKFGQIIVSVRCQDNGIVHIPRNLTPLRPPPFSTAALLKHANPPAFVAAYRALVGAGTKPATEDRWWMSGDFDVELKRGSCAADTSD